MKIIFLDFDGVINNWNNFYGVDEENAKIKERNKKVELDKSWETSWTRKICICALT